MYTCTIGKQNSIYVFILIILVRIAILHNSFGHCLIYPLIKAICLRVISTRYSVFNTCHFKKFIIESIDKFMALVRYAETEASELCNE